MTPLYKKLGLKVSFRAWVINYHENYLHLFNELPENIEWRTNSPRKEVNFVHLFASSQAEFEQFYFKGRDAIAKDGMLWISWPKGRKTIDINRDVIRVYGGQWTCGCESSLH